MIYVCQIYIYVMFTYTDMNLSKQSVSSTHKHAKIAKYKPLKTPQQRILFLSESTSSLLKTHLKLQKYLSKTVNLFRNSNCIGSNFDNLVWQCFLDICSIYKALFWLSVTEEVIPDHFACCSVEYQETNFYFYIK